MWSNIWSVVTSRIGFYTRIWSTQFCGLRQEVACLFQCWFSLTVLITLVVLMWKWMALLLRKNHLLRCCGCLSLLNWIGPFTLFLLLKLSMKIAVLIYSMKFLFLVAALYLNIVSASLLIPSNKPQPRNFFWHPGIEKTNKSPRTDKKLL